MLITDYLTMQKKYEAQYGERTVVLMEVGAFFECWEFNITYCTSPEAKIDDEKNVWDQSIGHAMELSVVLNCILTFEDKNEPYGIKNPHKIGFPTVAYEKNRDTLLANDYTIVRVDQEKNGKNNKGPISRFVAEVCSPTMQIDSISTSRATSNIACIYIEYQQGIRGRLENFLITTGAAVVDVITGQNRVCEFYSKSDDQIHAIQELYRFLISHAPREVIIHVDDMPTELNTHTDEKPNPYIKYLETVLELRRYDRLTVRVNAVSTDYKKLPYQIEFLNKIFTKKPESGPGIHLSVIHKRNDRIIEEMGLERMNYGRVAYMLLMQHCYSHNASIISKLAKPDLQWIDGNKHLILTHNAIIQLDLISTDTSNSRNRKKAEIDSLMSVIDETQTLLGKRLLHSILQNPMLNPSEINTYYDMVGDMLNIDVSGEVLWMVLDRQLRELPDIGRLQRKLEIKLITPKELALLYGAYMKLINIYITILNTKSSTLTKQMFTQGEGENFNEFIQRYTIIFDFEALECCSIDTSSESNTRWLDFWDCPIKPGIYQDLDLQVKTLETAEISLQQIVDHMNKFLDGSRGKKIEFRSAKKKQGAKKQDPTGTILTTTAAKGTTLLNSRYDNNLCGNIQILPYTGGENLVTSDRISELCNQIDNIKMWIRQRLLVIYESIIEEMNTKYTFYVAAANLIAKLDLVHSYAKITHLYNYHRPEIITEGEGSYLDAKEIRHPIIERIIDGCYVTNDISLGKGNSKPSPSGILLYGVNQIGKSSLSKALALNIIMAQIGCYVPSKLKYKPYSKIITRLSGSDNIFKGQSSFTVEMTELRTILRQSDNSTLVIGDELCKTTETDSGMAITASTILALNDVGASFIFATHMHDLLKLSYIRNIPHEQLRICHLSIEYNEVTKDLIYDRKLRDGSGLSIYGLMIAKYLELPILFIEKAGEILSEIMQTTPELIPTEKSRYNSDIYMDCCVICKKNKQQTQLHSHHIIEQKYADERGLIGNMHKDVKNNILILCEACHRKLHAKGSKIEVMTVSNGTIVTLND